MIFMHMGKTIPIPLSIAFLLLTAPLTGSLEHPTYPDFAEPTQFTTDENSLTFPDDQSQDSIIITITDTAIYRHIQTSFDGHSWTTLTVPTSSQCTSHPEDTSGNWLTGTCTLNISSLTILPLTF
jgi:hypothetical protein